MPKAVYEIEAVRGRRTHVSKAVFMRWDGRKWKNGKPFRGGEDADKEYTVPDHTVRGLYKIRCTKTKVGTEYDLFRNNKLVASRATLPETRRVMKFLKRRDFQRRAT